MQKRLNALEESPFSGKKENLVRLIAIIRPNLGKIGMTLNRG
jgi:hypothetical protein